MLLGPPKKSQTCRSVKTVWGKVEQGSGKVEQGGIELVEEGCDGQKCSSAPETGKVHWHLGLNIPPLNISLVPRPHPTVHVQPARDFISTGSSITFCTTEAYPGKGMNVPMSTVWRTSHFSIITWGEKITRLWDNEVIVNSHLTCSVMLWFNKESKFLDALKVIKSSWLLNQLDVGILRLNALWCPKSPGRFNWY